MKNLFEVSIIGPLLSAPWFWRAIRIALLLVLLAMVVCGWHHHAIPGVETKDPLMYVNLATYFFWVLWIMGVVFVALFFGRAWCAVCPLGWLNGLMARIGLRRELPAPLRNYIPVTLTLVALQLAVYLLAIHRYPDYTARLLVLMLVLTVLCGLLFRRRAFCHLFCPAGAVFGLYARIAPFQLRVGEQGICAACPTKECVSGGALWRRYTLGRAILYWRGERDDCPAELMPAEIHDSSSCTLCLHCAQNCEKRNIAVGFRPWLADLANGTISPSEGFFFVVLLGMLTTNFVKVYTDLREVVFRAPQISAQLLGWGENGFYLLAALWVTLVFPLLLLLPGYLIELLASTRRETVAAALPTESSLTLPASGSPGFMASLGRLAFACTPLILAVHVVLAVVKLNAKGGYLPFVLQDPSGVKSYLAMNVMKTVNQPGVLIPLDILKWVVLAILAAGYGLAIVAARRVAAHSGERGARGYLAGATTVATLLAAIYGATIVRWLFIR